MQRVSHPDRGAVDGGYVYFRARWDRWQLAIGRTADEAVTATIEDPGPPVSFSGDCNDSSDHTEARAILDEYLPKLRLQCPTP